VSTGFCVSVGWPLTSPGRDDMPGSLVVPLEGLAGRATLPDAPWSAVPEVLGVVRVSLAEPLPLEPVVLEPVLLESLLLAPVSVPEVVGLLGAAGVVEVVLFSSRGGVSEGEVRVRCIELDSLRPCAPELSDFLWCFFAFFFEELELEIDSFALPFASEPLFTVSELELSLPMPVVVDAPPRLGTALDEVSRFDELSG
jgi:hypothetical protein